jgi:hypothetical protein
MVNIWGGGIVSRTPSPDAFAAFIRPLVGGLLNVALRASPSSWWRPWLLALVGLLARVLLVVFRLVLAVKTAFRWPV